MFKELLFQMTAKDVNYAFAHKLYINADRPRGIKEFMVWFTDSDLYIYLNEMNEHPDHFVGFMTGMSLLACVAIKHGQEQNFRELIDNINWEFADAGLNTGGSRDNITDHLIALESYPANILLESIRTQSMFFGNGILDLLQIIYAYEIISAEVDSELILLDELEEAEIIEEVEEWPELIG
jgi:hypothetical protein